MKLVIAGLVALLLWTGEVRADDFDVKKSITEKTKISCFMLAGAKLARFYFRSFEPMWFIQLPKPIRAPISQELIDSLGGLDEFEFNQGWLGAWDGEKMTYFTFECPSRHGSVFENSFWLSPPRDSSDFVQ